MICECDYDPPEFYRSEVVSKSRAAFKCGECRRSVPPGERYERVTGKWDSFVDTFKTCGNCLDLRIWMKNNVPCFCFAHGSLFDDVLETAAAAENTAPNEAAGLQDAAQRLIEAIRAMAAIPVASA